MTSSRLFCLTLAAAALLGGRVFSQIPTGPASETVAPARVPLGKSLDQLRQLDDGLAKKVDALCATIDSEAAAKHLPDPVAQSLRWGLRNLAISSATEVGAALGVSRLPVENEQVMTGIRNLETEWTAKLRERAALVLAAINEAQLRLGEVAKSAEKVTDLDPLAAEIDQLQDDIQRHQTASSPRAQQANTYSYPDFMRSLRRVLLLDSHSDAFAVSSALSRFQSLGQNNMHDAVDAADIRRRMERILAPFAKTADDAQQALDDALRNKKPSAELAPALKRFEEALKANQQAREGVYLGNNSSNQSSDTANTLDAYRNLVEVESAMDAGDFPRARSALNGLQEFNLKSLGATRAATYGAVIADWKKTVREEPAVIEKPARHPNKLREAWSNQLAAVKTPADLRLLAENLAEIDVGGLQGSERIDATGLHSRLNALLAAWTTANPEFLRQSSFEGSGALGMDITPLLQRIERDIFARSLGAPELNQPPLSDLPPDKALDQFSDQLAAKSDWRRLLLLAEARSFQNGSNPQSGELAQAIRAYLTAQNFELAELWSDAVRAYKAVLLCTDARAPVQQAAEHLKALAKIHPEALSAPPTEGPISPVPRGSVQ